MYNQWYEISCATLYDYSETSDSGSDSSIPQLGLHLHHARRFYLNNEVKTRLFQIVCFLRWDYIPEENIQRNNAERGIFHHKNSEKILESLTDKGLSSRLVRKRYFETGQP